MWPGNCFRGCRLQSMMQKEKNALQEFAPHFLCLLCVCCVTNVLQLHFIVHPPWILTLQTTLWDTNAALLGESPVFVCPSHLTILKQVSTCLSTHEPIRVCPFTTAADYKCRDIFRDSFVVDWFHDFQCVSQLFSIGNWDRSNETCVSAEKRHSPQAAASRFERTTVIITVMLSSHLEWHSNTLQVILNGSQRHGATNWFSFQ